MRLASCRASSYRCLNFGDPLGLSPCDKTPGAPTASCELILLIYAEGGGTAFAEKLAIAHTVLNRVGATGFSSTVDGVIEQDGQFAGFQSDRYNAGERFMDGRGGLTIGDRLDFAVATAAAEAAANGSAPDNSGGAQWFGIPGRSPWMERQIRKEKLVATTVTSPFDGKSEATVHTFAKKKGAQQ